ncbi:hypothetical protein NX059_008545 [Plenodomus lindquistii]|nr:hypothetical protein NX059_008545 [Plenodomus lindquistii]
MKPRKRSIRDFFAPALRTPQGQEPPTTAPNTASANEVTTAEINSAPPQTNHSSNNQFSSFASTSSALSSVPTTGRALSAEVQLPVLSQTSANSGARKRVVSNGEQVVLNSDSDDNDSLQSLDFGEVQPKPTLRARNVVDQSRFSPEEEADELHRPAKRGKTAKKSFNVIVEAAQKNAEIERRIQEHKEELDRSSEEPTVENEAIDEERLKYVVQDDKDPEKAHRLFLAMQRTNAARTESDYYFFAATSESTTVQRRFPVRSLPKTQWASNFKDQTLRDQAFTAGFAHQVFRAQELPEELASWMLDQFCHSDNELLLMKYSDILEVRVLLHQCSGACLNDLTSDADLLERSRNQGEDGPVLPSSLKSIAILLQKAAPWLRTKVRSHALHILFFVCLDSSVLADASVLDTIRGAIESITCKFTDNKKLVSGVGSPLAVEEHTLMQLQLSDVIPHVLSRITDPILQRKLVCALPTRTPLTAYLQRYLALSFLLFPQVVDVPLAHPKIPEMVHKHLNTAPQFRINKKTAYGHIAAQMTLLDIAIGPGPLSVPYQPLVSPVSSQAGSSPITAPVPDSYEVKNFNKEVDALAQRIKLLGNSIVEAGAVIDLSILEAKDSTERLCARLEHAVRLGGKKVHNPFGGDDGEERQTKLSRFFVKPKKPLTPAPSSIFDNDDGDRSKLMG